MAKKKVAAKSEAASAQKAGAEKTGKEKAGAERVNKTQAVLKYSNAHPEATPSETAKALSKRGIPITASYVSNVKNKNKNQLKPQPVTPAVPPAVPQREVSVPEIKAAFALLKVCGDANAAKQAIVAAEEIQAMM